jgi:hypothetical protein
MLTACILQGQDIRSWVERNEKFPIQKIYVHTDREVYFPGDTVWMKAYLTDSRSGRLIPGAENVYIHLSDNTGKVLIDKTFLSVNGQAPGHLVLPSTLGGGNFLLSAFSDYLFNFGLETFFVRPLVIAGKARAPREIDEEMPFHAGYPVLAEVAFMPEGGKLLEEVSNLVAFKAISENGYGFDVAGKVIDELGIEVGSFKSDYKGMGIFFLTPKSGKSYRAVITGFPSFTYNLNQHVVRDGIKVQLVNQTRKEVIVNLASNSMRFSGENFYLVNMHRGEVVFYQPVKISDLNHLVKFESRLLKAGINQLVLLDKDLRPVSGRLLFCSNYAVNKLEIIPEKDIFNRRSLVSLSITGEENQEEVAHLSLAVVHEAALPEGGGSLDFLSSLLIDSELKGFIETPADYFRDTKISVQAKLSLLMLTNGWSDYLWNDIPNGTDTLKFHRRVGFDITGKVTYAGSGSPLENREIQMVVEKESEKAILSQNTRENGVFSFSGLLVNDTAKVTLQMKADPDSQKTLIMLEDTKPVPVYGIHGRQLKFYRGISQVLEKQKYSQDMYFDAWLRRQPKSRPVRIRKEFSIQPGYDGHFRMYDQADQVIEVPENESSYSNILDFLAGRVPGLDITGDQVTMRGKSDFRGNTAPLFLVDGIPVSTGSFATGLPEEIGVNSEPESLSERNSAVDKIKAIPLGDIDKVEILKSPQNMALFGIEGFNGVIAVYTRKGKPVIHPVTRDILETRIAGFTSVRRFYSPKYVPGSPAYKYPDYRITLFWDPEAVLTSGKADLSFYTSNQTGIYRILVEGISESGKLCQGSAQFEVK